MTRPRVLLFVQTGDGRPKCYSGTRPCVALQNAGEWSYTQRAWEARRIADRWWLVECPDAEHGRKVIAAVEDGGDRVECYHWGRILAHGSRP